MLRGTGTVISDGVSRALRAGDIVWNHERECHYFIGGANLGSIDSPNGWGDQTRAFTQQGGFIGAVNGDRNYYASLGDTWILSPTLVADVRVGLTRVAADNRASTFSDLNYSQFGIPDGWESSIGLAALIRKPLVLGAVGARSRDSTARLTSPRSSARPTGTSSIR